MPKRKAKNEVKEEIKEENKENLRRSKRVKSYVKYEPEEEEYEPEEKYEPEEVDEEEPEEVDKKDYILKTNILKERAVSGRGSRQVQTKRDTRNTGCLRTAPSF